ncbi:MAG: hypothetical protein WCJ30_13695 [Deltaproteobacteria bacterium]
MRRTALRTAALAVFLSACSDFRHGPFVGRDVVVNPYDGSCGHVSGATCNPYVQTGCAAGLACQLAATAAGPYTAACSVPGPGIFGARCASTTECGPGLVCAAGQCRLLCCPDDPAACTGGDVPTTARCDRDFGLGAMGLQACSAHCSWERQDCAGGLTCTPLDSAGVVSDCVAPGTGTNGATCGATTDCAGGFVCLLEAGVSVCRRVCNPTVTPTPCAFTQACLPVRGAPATFGACWG